MLNPITSSTHNNLPNYLRITDSISPYKVFNQAKLKWFRLWTILKWFTQHNLTISNKPQPKTWWAINFNQGRLSSLRSTSRSIKARMGSSLLLIQTRYRFFRITLTYLSNNLRWQKPIYQVLLRNNPPQKTLSQSFKRLWRMVNRWTKVLGPTSKR